MKKITLDYTNVMDFIEEKDMQSLVPACADAREKLLERTGAGNDFLGWVNLPDTIDPVLVKDIKNTAQEIRKDADAFICIGIGGSYLGARACIEAVMPNFYNQRIKPEIYFAGNSISTRYISDLLSMLDDKSVYVNVVSKSGTTTEPAIAFRIIWRWMVEKYGKKEAARRTIATTDAHKGALKTFADKEGMKSYVIPDDVGGRFSVLTPVGLLPIAVAGINIDELIAGAKEGGIEYRDIEDISKNPAAMYAIIRNALYKKGKIIEIMANFEPQIHYVSEWWKQLYGESEGKEGKGIFPASVDFTTDLHSMGQWIQEGRREIFETFINLSDQRFKMVIESDEENLDQLNFIAGRTLSFVNEQALEGTKAAHKDGGVPNMTIGVPMFSPHCIGKLFYFFEWAVGLSGYMLGVNPFDQPGVEAYKKNMFALLGKPGFEEQGKKMHEKLQSGKKYLVG